MSHKVESFFLIKVKIYLLLVPFRYDFETQQKIKPQLDFLIYILNQLQNQEMEKTILYSKKSSTLSYDLKKYQTCQHDHCKHLVSHIKFLSNALTEKLLKDQLLSSQKILKEKQNLIDQKIRNSQLNKTIEEEMESIKKNYVKLRKQLNQISIENDQLFQENQNLKKKIEKLEENSLKSTFQLSITKCNDYSALNSKDSFFTSAKGDSGIEPNPSDLYQRNQYNASQMLHRQLNLKFQGTNNHRKQTSTDRSNIYNRYQKLMSDFKQVQSQTSQNEQKIHQLEYSNKKLQYQNNQLKKIIKLRNQIQNTRHKAINHMRTVLDQIQA